MQGHWVQALRAINVRRAMLGSMMGKREGTELKRLKIFFICKSQNNVVISTYLLGTIMEEHDDLVCTKHLDAVQGYTMYTPYIQIHGEHDDQ